MRTTLRLFSLVAVAAALTACDNPATAPTTDVPAPATDDNTIGSLVVDYGITASAASLDASGIGGSDFPSALALTTEQKAAVITLQRRFDSTNAGRIAQLRGIEDELRRAQRDNRPRAERDEILRRGLETRRGLDSAFNRLRDDVSAVYTPPQRDWVAANPVPICAPTDGPQLTEEQKEAIRALMAAFNAEVAELQRFIQQVVAEARAAQQAGASRAEIEAILAKADEAKRQIVALEQRLRQAINGILTDDQRRRRCNVTTVGTTARP